jgi:hypothetical protein
MAAGVSLAAAAVAAGTIGIRLHGQRSHSWVRI